MKLVILLLAILSFPRYSIGQSVQSDTMKVIVVSARVGESIDRNERDQFSLMPSVKNFSGATFYRSESGHIFALMESMSSAGEKSTVLQEYPLAVLFRIAEKINNFEAIIDRLYVPGEEVITMEVIGGPPLIWQPQVSSRNIPSEPRRSTPQQKEESPVTIEQPLPVNDTNGSVEMRLSAGYGFSSGGSPLSNYTETRSSQPSYSERTNVDDDYVSAGQGFRYEMRFVVPVTEILGVFVEGGRSSMEAEQNSTYTTLTSSPPSSFSYTTRALLSFASSFGAAGMQFRLKTLPVKPYGGAGIGLWFPSELNKEQDISFGTTTIRQNTVATFETSVGYTGFLGVSIPVTSMIDLFVEGKSSFVMFYVKGEEINLYRVNDVDRLSTLTTRDKMTYYEANKNVRTSPENNPNVARFGGPPYPIAGGSASLSGGFSIRF